MMKKVIIAVVVMLASLFVVTPTAEARVWRGTPRADYFYVTQHHVDVRARGGSDSIIVGGRALHDRFVTEVRCGPGWDVLSLRKTRQGHKRTRGNNLKFGCERTQWVRYGFH